jgi:hypothetical protein
MVDRRKCRRGLRAKEQIINKKGGELFRAFFIKTVILIISK